MAISGYELRETRAEFRENQAQFADRLGVSSRTIGTWEKDGVPEKSERQVLRSVGRALYRVRDEIARNEYYNSDAWMADMEASDPDRRDDVTVWKGEHMFGRYQRQLATVGSKLEGIPTEDILFELVRRGRDPQNKSLREWKAMFIDEDPGDTAEASTGADVSALSDDELREVDVDELRRSGHALAAGSDRTTDDEDDVTP